MKKILTIVLFAGIMLNGLAQKKELKQASKAIDAHQYPAAIAELNKAKPLISNAKDKYKAQYYFLLGKAYYQDGNKLENTDKVLEAFNKLFEIEKTSGQKYSADARKILDQLKIKLYGDAGKEFNAAYEYLKSDPDKSKEMYSGAAEKFYKIYDISQGADTVALYQAARGYFFGKNYNKTIEYGKKLIELGYTGAGTQYSATSVANGQKIYFKTKKDLDKQVKLKIVKDPETKVFESQVPEIYKMISNSYLEMKDYDKALEYIGKARELKPNSYNYVIDEANIYFFKGDKNKFREKLEEAIKINPNNAVLHFNIGVMKAEQGDIEGAISSYKKAIELNPNYVDAYNNLGATILEEAKPIVEEMNNTNDFDKYDELQKKQLEIYRNAMPYYEKAYELAPNRISVVQTLLGIYENLEIEDKAAELRKVYKELKNQ